jgi:hypothetical protein
MPTTRQRRGNVDLGATIKAARSARGLSREGLGARLGGVHPDTIGGWERGEWLPGPQNIRLLARVLELPVERLERLLVVPAGGAAQVGGQVPPAAGPTVAGWPEVLGWGWSAHDLLAHLVALDNEAFGCRQPAETLRAVADRWAPIYAQVPDCWRLICSEPGHVVANWTLLPLTAEAFEAYRAGELLESEIAVDHLELLVMPGLYRAVVIDFVIRPAWTTAQVRLLLFRSLVRAMAELARLGIFFEEAAAHTQTTAGRALCRGLGMRHVCASPRAAGTDVFALPLLPMPVTLPLFRDAELAALYRDMSCNGASAVLDRQI